jgi:internalin A
MKQNIQLILCLVTTCGILASAAEPAGQSSAQEALAWLKNVDGQLKKSKLADLTIEQLATLGEVTLGGHRKSDNKHISISAEQFQHLNALPSLRKLVLWENDGVTDDALVHVGKLTNLRELELGDAPISSIGIKQLPGLKSLTFLSLAFTRDVGDSAMPDIAGLPNLEVLLLSGTKVTDAGLKQVATMKKLREIRLAVMPQVTDAGLKNLQSCASLRTVIVNKKTGVTPEGISAFSRLRPDCEVVVK